MVCHNCQINARKNGKSSNGAQRWSCKPCSRTWTGSGERLLGEMRLPVDKAVMCLSMLVEGSGIRSTARVTGVDKDTITKLLAYVGEKCERFASQKVRDVPVEDVECDELWGFVRMKERTKVKKRIEDERVGDAYCFVGMERTSKLVLAWHLGRRTVPHTDAFVEKLDRATDGRFQVSTDGFAAYPESLHYHLGTRTDYAQLIKKYGHEDKDERRYSPPSIIGIEKTQVYGDPKWDRVCTSHIERLNLSLRIHLRRLTRLTNGFSRKWSNLRAALSLYLCHYNFCRSHSSLSNCTPAMVAGVASKPWTMLELLEAVTL